MLPVTENEQVTDASVPEDIRWDAAGEGKDYSDEERGTEGRDPLTEETEEEEMAAKKKAESKKKAAFADVVSAPEVAAPDAGIESIKAFLKIADPLGKRSPAPGSPGEMIEGYKVLYRALDGA